MAIRAQAITICYIAWDTTAQTGKTGDVANHTLRLVRDGTEATPANAPSEVDATNAKGVYKLTLTAAEMTVDTITVCGVSSTANVTIIPVNLITESGDLAALTVTLALIQAHTDLIVSVTNPGGVAPSPSGKHIVSGLVAYCTAAQMTARYDYRTIGRLLVDDETRVLPTLAQVQADTTLASLLMVSSGRVETACLRGGRYTSGDLTALATTNAGELLAELVADLTMWRLYNRRPDRKGEMPPACKDALEILKELSRGEEIWPFAETQEAGHLNHSILTAAQIVERDNRIIQQRRYMGTRSDQEADGRYAP